MRCITVLSLALVVGSVLACSSSDEPACQVVGTYSVKETRKTGNCPETSTRDTFTISQNGTGYFIETAGVTGGCPADLIGQCKIQSKCDLEVKDPKDPDKSTGTLQISWTIDATGLTGTTVLSVPPATPIPDGCTSEFASDGIRK